MRADSKSRSTLSGLEFFHTRRVVVGGYLAPPPMVALLGFRLVDGPALVRVHRSVPPRHPTEPYSHTGSGVVTQRYAPLLDSRKKMGGAPISTTAPPASRLRRFELKINYIRR